LIKEHPTNQFGTLNSAGHHGENEQYTHEGEQQNFLA
jgi:hypothetical protein